MPATFRWDLTAEQILAVEAVWGPWRTAAVERLVASNFPAEQMPEHWHWDWHVKVAKLRKPGYRGVGVECAGQMQGMILLTTTLYNAQLPPDGGATLVYVDYLESAPWNVKPLAEGPLYGAVGARLLAAAMQVSHASGCQGRLGLHSLPQAEAFYQACGMTRIGVDPQYESLVYFEFTSEQAQRFLDKEEGL